LFKLYKATVQLVISWGAFFDIFQWLAAWTVEAMILKLKKAGCAGLPERLGHSVCMTPMWRTGSQQVCHSTAGDQADQEHAHLQVGWGQVTSASLEGSTG
jgi:hypothetical protein